MEAQQKQGQGVPLSNDDYLIQGSDAWKSKRRQSITATDISKIIGVNKYCTANKLWKQKLGLEEEEKENDAMRLGSALEPVALKMFIEKTGIEMSPCVKFHEKNEWKMASLDGISICGKHAVEIKCSRSLFEKAKNGLIDEIYMCQIQWQMYIAKIEKIYFACYWDNEIIIMSVERDDDFLNEIMPKIHDFRNRMMEFDPPPLVEKDYIQKDDKDWRMIAHLYNESSKELEICKARNEALRQELIKMSGGQSCKGGGVILTKSSRLGSIKYDSIEALKSVDLNKYRKPSIEVYTIREDKNVTP